MALRKLASEAASLGLRCGAPTGFSSTGLLARLAATRGYSSVKDGLLYAKSHEYAAIDGGVATVGISDHAQSELGDVVYVELPEVGSEVVKGETFGVVESVKAASDVYSPVTGEVIEANTTLSDDPAKVNKEPYSGGWMIKVKLSNPSEASSLLDAVKYKEHIDG